MPIYDTKFFDYMTDSATRSAERIVPLVLDLVKPRSVIDVGCGTGAWAAAFLRAGVDDCWGADGEWVDTSRLQFPAERFIRADLSQTLVLPRRFDLVVSLEVAEHLPESCADVFVQSLVALGPVVLFSAAIPHQGGTHHVNEQWPDYWTERFARHGYRAIDCVRPRVWDDPVIAWYYAQNTIIYAAESALAVNPALSSAAERSSHIPLRLVHPMRFQHEIDDRRLITQTAAELAAVVTPSEPFILIDDEQLRSLICVGARTIPFTNNDGIYWGPPQSDDAAIAEIERLRATGAKRLVIAWPAFWWLTRNQLAGAVCSTTFGGFAESMRRQVLALVIMPDSGW